ncbi:MAG: primosomal protein N' [Pseudomonadota bacterium]
MRQTIIVKVAVPVPLYQVFDYRSHDAEYQAGMRVKVPFGRRYMIGVVMAISDKSDIATHKLRMIDSRIDEQALLPDDILELCHWTSIYYHHPLGEVIAVALPVLLRQGKPAQLHYDYHWQLTEVGKQALDTLSKRAIKQKLLLQTLYDATQALSADELKSLAISSATINTAYHKKFIEKINCIPKPAIDKKSTALTLNAAQLNAVNAITQAISEFQVLSLEGITGSGKTEVYLQSIQSVLARGLNALVMVPEISLTPQMTTRFRQRFHDKRLVLLHSQLNNRQRLNAWLQARDGQARIIIGTRSAVFTPIKNLGMIIIDEEHDLSYKQQDGLRYSARDIAIRRAQMLTIPIVLGSATPSLETLYNTQKKRYHLLHLPERAGAMQMPRYRLIDIRNQQLDHGLSSPLLKAMETHLSRGHQVLLFLNRRGYAPTLLCPQCSWIAKCARCNVNMVLHQRQQQLRCHHCGATRQVDQSCPECHHPQLIAIGVGTERLEQSLLTHFPQRQIVRIDRDATRSKDTLQPILDDITNGKADILIGTQMLAKGHHFPKVTLVGVINADGGFFSADFRAVERMGQLLLQVAGRAGRGEQSGEVLIQTAQPENRLLQTLIQQGYRSFTDILLRERQACHLPPYCYAALIRAEATDQHQAIGFLKQVKHLMSLNSQVEIYGPVTAPMSKRAGYYRAQLLLQSDNRQQLHQLLTPLVLTIQKLKQSKQVRWSLDIDPQEMF